MKVDLDDIERKARAATPGPWRFGDWDAVFGTREVAGRMTVLERNLTNADQGPYIVGRNDGRHEVLRLEEPVENEANAHHIAANSPPVTLALTARIRDLERALHEALNYWSADFPGHDEQRDRLRAIAEKGTVIA